MGVLDGFRPKLVGPVLDGTATVNSPIELHVFSDSPEAVAAALEGRGFRLHDSQRRYRFGREATTAIPGFDLMVDDEETAGHGVPRAGTAPLAVEPHRRQTDAARVALRRARVARAAD